ESKSCHPEGVRFKRTTGDLQFLSSCRNKKASFTHSGSWLGRNSLRLLVLAIQATTRNRASTLPAPSPEEAAGKGEPIISNQIHLREFSQTPPSISAPRHPCQAPRLVPRVLK